MTKSSTSYVEHQRLPGRLDLEIASHVVGAALQSTSMISSRLAVYCIEPGV